MNFAVLFEKVTDEDFPAGYYYAHVPSLGLTTHGLGIDGARQAAADLLRLWIAEKHANGETIPQTGETLLGAMQTTLSRPLVFAFKSTTGAAGSALPLMVTVIS